MSHPTFFSSSSQVAILGGQFIQNNVGVQDDTNKHLMLLYNQVSPNAILNSGGRVDPVRCFPGTREEVIGRPNLWMTSGFLSDRRIFWLSGPAGAGKSAIVQTIAENWIKRNAAVATFFFFRSDLSRSDSRPLVATLLFQILGMYPELKSHINSIIESNPVILRQSAPTQSQRLLHEPMTSFHQFSPNLPPIILLVDGLDECGSESAKEDQKSILYLLDSLVTAHQSPFIALVASRPEPHIVMTFNEIGTFNNSIFLDASYRPADDIRRFIVAELASIKSTHHLGRSLDRNWPPEAIITSIVEKSSGQFVYAATVARFIRNSSASPAINMQIVLGLRPIKKVSPFKDIDAIYAHILSQAEDWDTVRDVLATDKILKTLPDFCGMDFHSIWLYLNRELSSLGYNHSDVESGLSDLTSIIRLEARYSGFYIQFYHASLEDFLYDQTRAEKFYIDLNPVACNLLAAHFKDTPHLTSGAHTLTFMEASLLNNATSLDTLTVILHIFRHVTNPTAAVTQALQYAKLTDVPFYPRHHKPREIFETLPSLFLAKVDELYKQKDFYLCESIARNWSTWFLEKGIGVPDPSRA